MSVLNDSKKLNAYSLDMQPANVYIGESKVAGWHAATASGQSPLAVDCDYNVPPDALTIDGKCVQTGTPSPTTPAPISTITGDVGITGCGKNLLSNIALYQEMGMYGVVIKSDFYKVAKGSTNYAFSAILPAGNRYYSNENIFLYAGIIGAGIRQTITLTTLSDEVLASKSAVSKSPIIKNEQSQLAPIWDLSIVKPQIEIGTTATEYEPYLGDTATVAFGSAVCASLPDGTHDTYDAITGVLTKRVGKYIGASGTSWAIGDAVANSQFISDCIPSGTLSGQTVTASAACVPTVYYKLATPTTVQLTPHLPVVRTGIKTLSIGADVVPNLAATVKAMD